MPDSIPSREEIAEILSPHLGAGSSSPGVIADALLARLRPAWERMILMVRIAYPHGQDDDWSEAPDQCMDPNHATLQADLRACAEALEILLPAMDSVLRWIESHKSDLKELTAADFKMFRDSVNDAHAALARRGGQAEGK